MSIKVGDRVRILDGRENPNIFPIWAKEMDELIGEVRIVERVFMDSYGLSDTKYLFAEEWLAPADDFTKDDLKEFDIVEFRNGCKTWVLEDIAHCKLSVGGFSIDTWKGDLKDKGAHGFDGFDIMKVYRPTDSLPLDKSKWKDLPVVYERTEVKEMTVEEISKALGYEVKVVK